MGFKTYCFIIIMIMGPHPTPHSNGVGFTEALGVLGMGEEKCWWIRYVESKRSGIVRITLKIELDSAINIIDDT
jgi:hypothetical protein